MDEGVASFLVHFNGTLDEHGDTHAYIGGKSHLLTLPYTSGFDKLIEKIHDRIGTMTNETKIGVKCQVPIGRFQKLTIIDIEDDEDLKAILEMFKNSTISLGLLYITKSKLDEGTQPTSTSMTRDEWLQSIKGAEEKQQKTHSQFQTPNPSIHKVPQGLRDNKDFKRYYDQPSVVKIGPLHNSNPRLQQVEELKLIIANKCLKSLDQPLVFFNKFEMKIKEEAKKLYDEGAINHLNDEAFIRMMFLDGCFVLHFIHCIVSYNVKDLGMKNYLIAKVQQDLFLLENQLPFLVLRALIELVDKNPWSYDMLDMFADRNSNCPLIWTKYQSSQDKEPLHLLDLLRTRLIGQASRYTHDRPFWLCCLCWPFWLCWKCWLFWLYCLCWPFLRCWWSWSFWLCWQNKFAIDGHLFRGVKELTAAGIYLKPNLTGDIKDVHFRSYGIFGRLTLPRMTIDSSTKQIFLKLIGYELCMDPQESWVISYLCFLDLLIDHADDVKELRTAGILENLLGSDEEVAKLFNEIAADLEPDIDTYNYVKVRIQSYFSHRGKTRMALWLADVLHNHFKSPWTTIAVFAGFIAIFLTSVQTYFAVFPPLDNCN